jgi:hypothetical protein
VSAELRRRDHTDCADSHRARQLTVAVAVNL